jgi:asparagine synthase (glutamine-hydrolysing)
MLSIYQKSWLVEDLLMKADKATMAASLEARTPFLDYRLVEWANRQPNSVKVKRVGRHGYRTKNVLRRFSARRLPSAIIDRPKLGFPVPAYRWLQNGLDIWARELLLNPKSKLTGALRKEAIEGLIKEAREGYGDASHRVWLLIVLELWLQRWNSDLS